MFTAFDHVNGAILVRFRRFFLKIINKPDISLINSNLYVGGASDIESLVKTGIRDILDLRYELQDDPEMLEKYAINYLRIRIHDRGIPNIEDTVNAINWIRDNINNNRKVFLHCNLGRGRAPLLAVIYLISEGMQHHDAIKLVKKNRVYTYFNKKQLQLIKEFNIRNN